MVFESEQNVRVFFRPPLVHTKRRKLETRFYYIFMYRTEVCDAAYVLEHRIKWYSMFKIIRIDSVIPLEIIIIIIIIINIFYNMVKITRRLLPFSRDT